VYTIFMKRHIKKYFSLNHYVAVLRKHPAHLQHVYALIFAGSITSLIAFVILYTEYGFWHEKYVREESVIVEVEQTTLPPKPSELFFRFLDDAKVEFDAISATGSNFFDGKETYIRSDN
jgi:hypothetical protein